MRKSVLYFLDKASDWYFALVLIAVLILVGFTISGCNYHVDKGEPPPVIVPATLTFSSIQSSVLTPYCMACHTAGPRDLSNYNAVMQYVKFKSPENSSLCQVLLSGRMPIGRPLPKDLISSVCEWIAQGSPEA